MSATERDRRRTFLVAQGAEATRGTTPLAQAAEDSARRVVARSGVKIAGRVVVGDLPAETGVDTAVQTP